MRVYIDMDSGTVLNGPVYVVEAPDSDIDYIMDSDSAAREYALYNGREAW